MFDETDDNQKLNNEPSSALAVEAQSQIRERPSKKQREVKKREPEDVYILANNSEKTFQILVGDELIAAGARVVNDSNLRLYKATPLEPKITF